MQGEGERGMGEGGGLEGGEIVYSPCPYSTEIREWKASLFNDDDNKSAR